MVADVKIMVTLCEPYADKRLRMLNTLENKMKAKFIEFGGSGAMDKNGNMEITFHCYSDSDWGDVRDLSSGSGTAGGLVITFDPAEAEISAVMKQLYLEDVVDDWTFQTSLPEDQAAA